MTWEQFCACMQDMGAYILKDGVYYDDWIFLKNGQIFFLCFANEGKDGNYVKIATQITYEQMLNIAEALQ